MNLRNRQVGWGPQHGHGLSAVALALGWVWLFGCGDTPQPMPPASPRPLARVDQSAPVEETPVVSSYMYTPVGKRDPFRSFYKDLQSTHVALNVKLGPLQMFEIDQLKLVGVVSGIAQPRAMVEDPAGKGYVVQIGTMIGKNFGRVVRITADGLIIAEDYRDPNGRPVINNIHLTMQKDKEKD